jgi:hypothetical protein
MATKGTLIGTLPDGGGPNADVECTTYESTSTDYLRASDAAMGIGSVWSMAWWQRRTTPGQSFDRPIWQSAEDLDNAPGSILWTQQSDTICLVQIRDDAGTLGFTNVRQLIMSDLLTAWSGIEWEHIAFVYNSNGGSADDLTVYYNGANMTTKTTGLGEGDPKLNASVLQNPNHTANNRNMAIGADSEGNNPWAGEFYNFGVWDVELTDAAVAVLYNEGAGSKVDLLRDSGGYSQSASLQHYWRFDNGGDRGEDLGVNATKMDLLGGDSGAHTFATDNCPQILDDGVQDMSLLYDNTFNMQSDGFTFASGIDASVGSVYTFSFAAWAKFDGAVDGGRDHLISVRQNAAASALDWGMDDNSNTDMTASLVNASQSGRINQTWHDVITPDTWHHIVLTWDGTTGSGSDAGGAHMYVDGVNVDTVGTRSGTSNDGSNFNNSASRRINIGTQLGSSGTNWEGPIFTASIYNSQLSAADVLALYAGGDALAVDPRVNSGNYSSANTLLHYYRLGLGRSDVQFGRDYTLLGNAIGLKGGADYPGDLTTDTPNTPGP